MLRREMNQCKVNYFGGTGMQNVFSFASPRFCGIEEQLLQNRRAI